MSVLEEIKDLVILKERAEKEGDYEAWDVIYGILLLKQKELAIKQMENKQR